MPNTVLIVDDKRPYAESVDMLFKRSGWVSKAVFSGPECVEAVRESAFDAVLLDMRMPGMDGFATLREALKVRPDLCVVLNTAYGDIENAVRALQEGATNFVLKPLEFNSLLVIVGKTILSKRAEVDARKAEVVAREKEREMNRRVLTLALGLAHNINNALGALNCRVDLLAMNISESERKQYIDEARKFISDAVKAIGLILSYGKLSKLSPVAISVSDAVRSAVETAVAKSRAVPEPEVRIEDIAPGLEVISFEGLLSQAIECIVSNSLEAVGPAGEISISALEQGETVALTVYDNGPGFPDDKRATAAEPGESSKRNHYGLGLAFAKAVAEGSGGRLIYGNREDIGGAFVTMELKFAGKQ